MALQTKGLRAQDDGGAAAVPPGAFEWATVYSFGEREGGQVRPCRATIEPHALGPLT